MKARLVLHRDNRGWILEKFAMRLAENLGACGVDAEIADAPSAAGDINHWLLYLYYDGNRTTPTTALITHIDVFAKLRVLKTALETLDAGICLSRDTVETLVRRGVRREKLCYVTPGHDALVQPKRFVIGITSRAYGDGRKREWMLVELARAMRLDRFRLEFPLQISPRQSLQFDIAGNTGHAGQSLFQDVVPLYPSAIAPMRDTHRSQVRRLGAKFDS